MPTLAAPSLLYNPRHAAAPRGLASIYRAGSIAEFRAAAPLPKNTQEMIDSAVVRVGRQRLVIVSDLLDLGLIYPLPNWLAVPVLTSHRIGEAGHAQRSMVPKTRGERQVIQWTPYSIPIPCTFDDFSFNVRELAAAERTGQPLDTSHAEQATRNVNLAFEDAMINGGPTIDGNTSPGLLSSTNTYTYTGSEAWDVAGHTGEEIVTDVLAMIDALQADKFYGPYRLYIPTTYGSKLNQDFKSATSGTIRERLEAIDVGNGQRLVIKVADLLPADRAIMLQTTSEVVDIILGQQPVPVTWTDGPEWEHFFVVLGCLVPRVKSNTEGNYGIVVGNKV